MTEKLISLLWALSFWAFIAIKVAGTSLADWSWWWIFIPIVPIFGYAVQRFGL